MLRLGLSRLGRLSEVGTVVRSYFFRAPLSTNILMTRGTGTPTYSRPSPATVIDHEGRLLVCKTGEARMQGWRRVENLYANSTTLVTQSNTVVAGVYLVQFRGTGTVTLSGAGTGTITGTGANNLAWALITTTAGTLTSTVSGSCTSGQLENVTGQSIQTPAEYVPVGTGGPNYGAELWNSAAITADVGWSKSGTAYNFTNPGSGGRNLYQSSIASAAGEAYLISCTVTGTGFIARFGSVTFNLQPGANSFALYPTGTNAFEINGTSATTGSIDNLSVKKGLFSGATVDGVKYFDTKLDGTAIPKTATSGYLNEPQRTNGVRNNSMIGAVAGVLGSGGALPTNWYADSDAGLTRTIVGTGVANGIPYIDIRFSGTAAGTFLNVYFDTSTSQAAVNGNTFVSSFYCALVGGSLTNVAVQNSVYERTSGGGYVAGTGVTRTPTAALTRNEFTRTLVGGGTVAAINSAITIAYSAGAAIDVTLRIGAPQLEQGSTASSVILTTTASAVRAADSLAMPVAANASQGTLVVTLSAPGADAAGRYPKISLCDGALNNAFSIQTDQTLSGLSLVVKSNNAIILSQQVQASPTPNTQYRIAISFTTSGRIAWSVNGGVVGVATGITLPLVLSQILTAAPADYPWFGTITAPQVYAQALSDATLRALTA